MARALGIVLAAGASRRAGCIKALATLASGETLIARAIRTLREAGVDDVVVVIGAPHGARIARAIHGAAELAHSATPERGMLSSLIDALGSPPVVSRRPEAAIVSHVDRPHLRAATIRSLIATWRATGADLVEPRHRGRRGHPWLASRALLAILRDARPEPGARPVLRAVANRRAIDVDDPAVLDDLDTALDLARAGIDAPV